MTRILVLSDTHIGAGHDHRRDALLDTDRVLAGETEAVMDECRRVAVGQYKALQQDLGLALKASLA